MKRDHSKLICDISEIAGVYTGAQDLGELLQKIVEMTAAHMGADVCSIYLYYEETQDLVLRATKGLDEGSIGKVRLKLGEGLTGLALKEFRAVCEGDASSSPHFRYFAGIGEEKFFSFVAAPILRGKDRIGVMTLQSVLRNHFSPEDVNVFRAITSQLATTIEMAKLLIAMNRTPGTGAVSGRTTDLRFVRGRSGAEGFASGEAVVVAQQSWENVEARIAGCAGRTYTVIDLRRAVEDAVKELERLQKGIEEKLFDVASLIFSAQILILKDRAMLGAMESAVAGGCTPPEAVRSVIAEYVARFEKMSNAYFRERKYDVFDVGIRLLDHLGGRSSNETAYAGKIVVARELVPSDALKFSSQNVSGIVLLSGGVTSHVAVLARSLNIPLVIADDARLLELPAGTRMLLDGWLGNIYVNPDSDVVRKFEEREALRLDAARVAGRIRDETHTVDGVRVKLLANINLLGDLDVARAFKAEGVGLYRTEFPFMVRSGFPTEEEQFVIYRRFVEGAGGREITFRTLDVGGDKMLSYYDYSREANPFLGLRSIRFSLKHTDVFADQLKAILRAGHDRKIRIMFPMISSLDEFDSVRRLVRACLADLEKEGRKFQRHPLLGVMVELPATVELIEGLARESDFLSVGTNDLIQYVLAVDRTNEKVADLYLPHHPAVLRVLKRVVDAALKNGRDISICGDMAHEPVYIPFLLGIGVRKLSLDARYLPKVQEAVMATGIAEAESFAHKVLSLDNISAVSSCFERRSV